MNKTEIKQNVIDIELIDGSIAKIKDTEDYKALKSDGYNFFFSKKDGYFARWGKSTDYSKKVESTDFKIQFFSLWTNIWKENFNMKEFFADLDTDGSFEVTAVEIVDWEISELCDANCSFCYKSNVAYSGKNISFENFKETFKKLPPSVTTIAYGIGTISLCPDLFDILNWLSIALTKTSYNMVVQLPQILLSISQMTPVANDQIQIEQPHLN